MMLTPLPPIFLEMDSTGAHRNPLPAIGGA